MEKKSSSPASQPAKEVNWKRRALTWLGLFALACFLAFFALRWIGSTDLRGTVQRVYEKEAEYRIEFAELDGTVHVIGNDTINFPFFKVDTADVQAQLMRMSQTGDIIDVKVWGLRIAWFSLFPNVVDFEFVRSNADRTREQASQITDDVMKTLKARGVLKGGEGVRDDVLKAVERGLKASTGKKKPLKTKDSSTK